MNEPMIDEDNLDTYFGPHLASEPRVHDQLGIVVGGSLSKGLDVRLDWQSVQLEELAVGRYVVVRGQHHKFFGMITDIALDNTNAFLEKSPPDVDDAFLKEVYQGTSTFGRVHIAPMLVLEEGAREPKPVKTIPGHYSTVYQATEEDVDRVFGVAHEKSGFTVGEPLDMPGIEVNLDLKRFVERSSGVFGKSGTGKTFLTRLLLAGAIQQDVAVNLIFDMHNEYGWSSQSESHTEVKGLRQLFYDGKVMVLTLDPESSRRRNSKFEDEIRIGYDAVEPEDLDMLQSLLGLTDVQVGGLYYLRRKLGKNWVGTLLDEGANLSGLDESLEQGGLHAGTLGAIQRKLGILRRFGFLKPAVEDDVIAKILDWLNKGVNVVLEFGRYGNSLEAYILVANYITRRIHEQYIRLKEAAIGRQGAEPRPLVITIEEAHKFLDPQIARHTIFGTIARELRKYNVTLLIVDQRPSGIDEEVMSQLGTRVTCLLDNEADIRAVFAGIAGSAGLREVLARLDTRQQALIMGHAVPMPVVVKTRPYDTAFYASLGRDDSNRVERAARNRKILRGDDGFQGFD